MYSYRVGERDGEVFCLTDLNMAASSLCELLCALGLLKSSAGHWKEKLLFFSRILVLHSKVFSFRVLLTWLLWLCHQNGAFLPRFSRIFSSEYCITIFPHLSLGSELFTSHVEILAWGSEELFKYWVLAPFIFLWLKAWFLVEFYPARAI